MKKLCIFPTQCICVSHDSHNNSYYFIKYCQSVCFFNGDIVYCEVGVVLQEIIVHILCIRIQSVSVTSTEILYLTNIK